MIRAPVSRGSVMPESLALSLVSHTNVGKTTLARTLLARDVGEVRDAPHVTEFADPHVLLSDTAGHQLTVWDTPGFGDSARLVRRLRQAENPLGRLLSEVWDRWRDRPFWASQQVLRHVRDTSDIVLYLVNAAERPEAAGYVNAEMDLLTWVGKPVLVLLNQMGPPQGAAHEARETRRWAEPLQRWPIVKAVLPLDAFARCWVQEGALWQAVQAALPPQRRPIMAGLQAAWAQQGRQRFEASMDLLASGLAPVLLHREAITESAVGRTRDALRQVGAMLGMGRPERSALDLAERRLSTRVDDALQQVTQGWIALHGLSGDAGPIVMQRAAALYEPRQRVPEGRAAWVGGMLSGALGGLAADLAAGGFTLGGGLIAGGIAGALGAAGLARGLNVVRGTEHSWVGFSAEALPPLLSAALLRYLAVAHFGRGRGEWAEAEAPPHWAAEVAAAVAAEQAAVSAAAAVMMSNQGKVGPEAAAAAASDGSKAPRPQAAVAAAAAALQLSAALQPLLMRCATRVLAALYPDTPPPDPNNPAP
jgi:hypothetical protein